LASATGLFLGGDETCCGKVALGRNTRNSA